MSSPLGKVIISCWQIFFYYVFPVTFIEVVHRFLWTYSGACFFPLETYYKQWFITKFQLMAVTGSPRIVKLSLIFHEAVLADPLLQKI
jgi:hypothetical protein